MYILNVNFSFLKQIGEISYDKVNELKKSFSNYPEIIAQPNQPLVFKKGVNALAIQPDQIIYVAQGEPEEFDITNITSELAKLNCLLNLPNQSNFVLRFEAIESYDNNIMEASGKAFPEALKKLNAEGVGHRFFIRSNEYHGDVYIEPYINDHNKVFFNVILQSNMSIDITNANSFIEELFNFAVSNIKEVADSLYK